MLAPLLGRDSPDSRLPGPIGLRSYRASDAAALARYANQATIAGQMHDAEPRAYSLQDAEAWIQHIRSEQPQCHYSIAAGDRLAGGVALVPGADIYAHSAEISYWVADEFWGRGLATFAVREVTDIALGRLGFSRLFARVFAGNPASQRVLEKAGYELEGIMRRGACKDGQHIDLLQFARLR